jgi:hypothetical protein
MEAVAVLIDRIHSRVATSFGVWCGALVGSDGDGEGRGINGMERNLV